MQRSADFTLSELLSGFLDFMVTFDYKKNCFDVPMGRITPKKEIKRPIFNIDIDSDNNPYNHPYYIIDPFDVNHNPGKPLKFKSKLFPKY